MTPLRLLRRLATLLSITLALAAPAALAQAPAPAKTLRIATAFDPQTMDPQALALLYHTRVAFQLYESLVGRDEKFGLEPALALSWPCPAPTSWRFKLRPDVRFHDGSAFTADDAVFSLRARAGAAVAALVPAQGRDGGEEDRRAHHRAAAGAARRGAAREDCSTSR